MNTKMLMAVAALVVLSRSQPSSRDALPVYRGIIEPVHVLPGRMRMIVPSLIDNPEAGFMLKEKMERLESVTAVASSPVTGSLCVRYDPLSVSPLVLFGSVIRLLDLEPVINRQKAPLLWRELQAMGRGLSDAIHHLSHGLLDLKTLVGIGLLGIIMRDLLNRNDRLRLPGTFTIGWWAYQHFFGGTDR